MSWDGECVSWDGECVSWDGECVSWDGECVSWDGECVSWDGECVCFAANLLIILSISVCMEARITCSLSSKQELDLHPFS